MFDEQSPLRIDPPSKDAGILWAKALEVAQALGESEDWTLVGGLMVQLHALEHDRDTRLTTDIDVLGNARRKPQMTKRIAEALERLGGTMAHPPTSGEDLGYQFDVDGELIEVLGPDGLKADPQTTGRYKTFQVPGGTQALRRTEVVWVVLAGGVATAVRRPSLLGAILIKARVLAKRRRKKFESDRQDLIALLSFVDDPRDLAATDGLKASEKKWLADVAKALNFDDPSLGELFGQEQLVEARQAFEIFLS
jgi:hypothetical protein